MPTMPEKADVIVLLRCKQLVNGTCHRTGITVWECFFRMEHQNVYGQSHRQ